MKNLFLGGKIKKGECLKPSEGVFVNFLKTDTINHYSTRKRIKNPLYKTFSTFLGFLLKWGIKGQKIKDMPAKSGIFPN